MITDSIFKAIREWRNRSRDNYELNGMSDRQLADIGISRGDINAVVHGRLVRQARHETRT
ncbi:MAG: DUF1127 domain-containing protein [Alphaproteobacteria bacterium]|jgi:uncharacterized protein YjiS (DUF1127 family)|nr:DUF1127 domain-containing protein [Alphaproteobacteria bacterium]MDP6819359.1 DUF1127 domain-containing protein [Alphaproteobacteria bacterium]